MPSPSSPPLNLDAHALPLPSPSSPPLHLDPHAPPPPLPLLPCLQLVVNIAKEYTDQLGSGKIIELLEAHQSWTGLYFYLGGWQPAAGRGVLIKRGLDGRWNLGKLCTLRLALGRFTRPALPGPSRAQSMFDQDHQSQQACGEMGPDQTYSAPCLALAEMVW